MLSCKLKINKMGKAYIAKTSVILAPLFFLNRSFTPFNRLTFAAHFMQRNEPNERQEQKGCRICHFYLAEGWLESRDSGFWGSIYFARYTYLKTESQLDAETA